MTEDDVPVLEDYVKVRCSTCVHDAVLEENSRNFGYRKLPEACRGCNLGSNYNMTDEEELRASRALITVLRGRLLNSGDST